MQQAHWQPFSIQGLGLASVLAQAHWYLELSAPFEPKNSKMLFDPAAPVTVGLLNFMTFVILYSTLIPISLYVSIELIKFFQATKFINQVLYCDHLPASGEPITGKSPLSDRQGFNQEAATYRHPSVT